MHVTCNTDFFAVSVSELYDLSVQVTKPFLIFNLMPFQILLIVPDKESVVSCGLYLEIIIKVDYFLNIIMVGADLVLYVRNTRLDRLNQK